MNYYGPKDLAESFRTVRKNTLIIAEDIPEGKYGFRAADGTQTVGELLTHIAFGGRFQERVVLIEQRTSMADFDFIGFRNALMAELHQPRTKAEIVELLVTEGEKYATAVESLSEEFVAQSIMLPPGGTQASRTRFDLLLSVKEHEMHHRGQLMLIERMLGMTPHLTRDNQARMAAMRARMGNQHSGQATPDPAPRATA